ncbi:hypothetical protein PI95_003760 [Hassallia byssoidea VB512170]|uniref:Uncharacterized protein n=1 Tax=Hassallia byssoidea VB512170 TaxID=1304833 RepID=A0A846H3P0_9CYAN|nr:hypothetical protein [Hassalia byssoidea]NEU71723.1 hypothetical protein [Hassalia byssoidea VB512170]
MNSQPPNENVTNPEASYRDFNSDTQDSNNKDEASDESTNAEAINQDSSNEISLDNQSINPVLITIQILQNSSTAIISIGIKNATPIIKTISSAELTSHPIINDCLVELEKSLPEMLAICKQKENQIVHHNHQQSPPSVQKRELPESKNKASNSSNQLSLF